MSDSPSSASPLARLDPVSYQPHALHDQGRDWPETNCYADLWIELLHGLQLPVEPCLSFMLACDLEGDQWTFFKPPHADLEDLYGLRVEELALWRPVVDHVQEQVRLGRIPLVELDSFFLPDTAGTDYHAGHTKTTVAITAIDRHERRLTYFHNRSLHSLEGEDFDGIFRIGAEPRADYLPPYCEFVRLDRLQRRTEDEFASLALSLARRHFARRPLNNPIAAFGQAFDAHLDIVLAGDLELYHAYSFTSVRQLGASAELLASHARYMDREQGGSFANAASELSNISQGAKTLILKLARIANSKRKRDVDSSFIEMAGAWDRAMAALGERLG